MNRLIDAALLSSATLFLAAIVPQAEAAQVREVSFDSQGETLVGNLYLPDDYVAGQELPGIVVTGSWTSVKEQMSGLYAEKLADLGFAALAFDFRNFGESSGDICALESPAMKVEDTTAAAADEAAIATLVNSVATLADQGNFETLESLYADSVQIDYTSLFGGDVQTHTPASLMTAWASLLPGFDQTYHAISNIQVDVEGDRATATADVTASHYLGDDYWQVSGQYEYQLVRQSDSWKIETMTFELSDEQGDRALLEQAAAEAANNPSSYLQRQQTE